MVVDWLEVKKALYPMKDYEDLSQRLQRSFAYPFVCEMFNYTMPQLVGYTALTVGSDPRGRYNEYASRLSDVFTMLDSFGILNVLDLFSRVRTREQFRQFVIESAIDAYDVALVLKFLVYWFIPMEKPLSGLLKEGPGLHEILLALREQGIRCNLDLLQQGLTPAGRKALAASTGLPHDTITGLVHLVDLSRMPWASKATVSNIIGAGYGSLAQLSNADPEKLNSDFYAYGRSIGKNLKFGNEIENSFRIAKVVPVLLKEE